MFALVALLATVGPIDNPIALRDVAKQAAAEERWCDAHGAFRRLFVRTNELKHLYNAAEVARAAGDHVSALAAYREVRARDDQLVAEASPEARFPERARVERAIAELEAALANGDLGAQCPEPAPACGNGAIEGREACDDANADDGDGCTATCALAEPVVPMEAQEPPAETRAQPDEQPRAREQRGAPSPSPSPSPLVVTGAVGAVVGGAAALGLGAWALVLDSELRAPAPDVTSAQKDFALDVGWAVVAGAVAGVVVAAAGTALAFTGGEP